MPSYIQSSQSVDTSSERSTAISFSSVTLNDLVVCFILTTDTVLSSTSTVSISDNQATGGNTYSLIVTTSVSSGLGDGTATMWLYYTVAAKATGTFTVTATGSAGLITTGDIGLCVLDFGEINTTTPTLGLSSGSFSTVTTTTSSTPSLNSTTLSTLYVSAVALPNNEQAATALNNFTSVQTGSSLGNGNWFNASYLVSNGTQTGKFSFATAQEWSMLSVAFNPTSIVVSTNGIMNLKTGWWGDL